MKGRGGGDDVEGGDMTVSGAPTSISRSIIPLSTHEQACPPMNRPVHP